MRSLEKLSTRISSPPVRVIHPSKMTDVCEELTGGLRSGVDEDSLFDWQLGIKPMACSAAAYHRSRSCTKGRSALTGHVGWSSMWGLQYAVTTAS